MLVFRELPVPAPWNPARGRARTPLLVYGASSSLGAFAVKLAKLANIHPIIAVAGSSASVVKEELDSSKGDVLLDYREGDDKLIEKVHQIAPDLHFAADAIGSPKTTELCTRMVNPNNSVVSTSVGEPWDESLRDRSPEGVEIRICFSPGIFEPTDPEGPDGEKGPNIGPRAFAITALTYLSFALQRGLIKPHPYKVQPNGLANLSDSLKALKEGKNAGYRYLLEIGATP